MTKNNTSLTLNRQNSLKSKILIDNLFKKGQSLVAYPLRLVYLNMDIEQDVNYLVAFSVPKKKFKKAVERNLIKRLMRESFRHQQHKLKLSQPALMMWVYLDNKKPSYELVYDKMQQIIQEFNNQFDKTKML